MTEYGIIIEKYLKYISKSDNKVEIKSVKKGYFFIFKCISSGIKKELRKV